MTIEELEKEKKELKSDITDLSFVEYLTTKTFIDKRIQEAKLNESRKNGVSKIDMNLVLKSLRFIIENKDMPQPEFFDRLLELGCNYTYDDLLEQFPDFEEKDTDGFKELEDGAYLAMILRDHKRMRKHNATFNPFIQEFIENALSEEVNKGEVFNK